MYTGLVSILVLICCWATSLAQTVSTANFLDPALPCSNDVAGAGICTAKDANSICALTTAGTYACGCNEPAGFAFNVATSVCVKTSDLGEICELAPYSACIANAKCADAGDNSGDFRCKCDDGYVKVNDDPTDLNSPIICGLLQTTRTNGQCETCELNEGICFKKAAADLIQLCQCPSYRSGVNCETEFVSVSCNMTDLTTTICYTPQAGFDFSTDAVMYADGTLGDPTCMGVLDGACGSTNVTMVLSLADGDIGRCNTQKKAISVNAQSYQTTIVVAKNSTAQPPVDLISFLAYCSFQEYVNHQFQPIGYGSRNGNDRGEHKEPSLTLTLLDSLMKTIEEGVPVRLGDSIFMKITLAQDSTYAGVSVMALTASTKANLYDKDAFSRSLITDSCPAPGQSVFTNRNIFRQYNFQANEIIGGPLRVFAVPTQGSIFLHVKLKLCLKDSNECIPVDCTASAGSGGTSSTDTANVPTAAAPTTAAPGVTVAATAAATTASGRRRRKRETDESATLSRELIIENPDSSGTIVMSSTGFAIMVALLVLILFVFIVISALLYIRVRKGQPRSDKVGDMVFMTQKPQRFAMPRVEKPQLRL